VYLFVLQIAVLFIALSNTLGLSYGLLKLGFLQYSTDKEGSNPVIGEKYIVILHVVAVFAFVSMGVCVKFYKNYRLSKNHERSKEVHN
jgi:hypothetical protein